MLARELRAHVTGFREIPRGEERAKYITIVRRSANTQFLFRRLRCVSGRSGSIE